MSIKRWAAKRDVAEPAIIEALEAVGAQVEQIDYPCDLIVRYRGGLTLLEVDRANKYEKRKPKQAAFLRDWCVPKVKTPAQALAAIGIPDAVIEAFKAAA